MAARDIVEPTRDKQGWDSHPAYALIGASRVSVGGSVRSGKVLFDSDVVHQHLVRVRIAHAVRNRDEYGDRQHATEQIVELDLSEAQWASFVSSMNQGDGVPATLVRVGGQDVPDLPYAPRLAESMTSVQKATARAMADIRTARDAYEDGLARKVGAKERTELLRALHYAIENAAGGMNYAAERLGEHAENVVQRARADVEAMVSDSATRKGLDPADVGITLAIDAGPTASAKCEHHRALCVQCYGDTVDLP